MRQKIGMLQGLIAASGTTANAGITGPDVFGLFNIFVGLMVTAAILTFVTGFVVWVVRLGIIGRQEGIRIMEWGVVILFVLVVLLAFVQYFTSHSQAVALLIAAVAAIFIGWIVIQVIKGGGEAKEEH